MFSRSNIFPRLLLVLLLLLSACRQPRTPDYFPLVPGAARIMAVTERRITGSDTATSRETKVTEVVKGLKAVPGLGRVWVVEAPLGGQRSAMFYYQRHGDTIFKFVPGTGGRVERIIYLILPLAVGRHWFDSEQRRERTEVTGSETITVPAGTFQNCYRIETRSSRVEFRQTIWLAPGLGVVKRIKTQRWNQGDTIRELFRQEELVEYRVVRKGR